MKKVKLLTVTYNRRYVRPDKVYPPSAPLFGIHLPIKDVDSDWEDFDHIVDLTMEGRDYTTVGVYKDQIAYFIIV